MKSLALLLALLAALRLTGCAPKTPSTTDPPAVHSTQILEELRALLDSLEIVQPRDSLPSYDRSSWGSWRDDDSDCQNSREETLISEAIGEIVFQDDIRQCKVSAGQWKTPFSGELITDPRKLDVDHMVPLKNAHISGAWRWAEDTRRAYYNDLSYANHLVAVTSSANRSKGAHGPESWKPQDRSYWCQYATDWVVIKLDWGLTANRVEWAALYSMLLTCSEE